MSPGLRFLQIEYENDEVTLDVFQYIYGLADSLYSNAKEYVNEISHNVSQPKFIFI